MLGRPAAAAACLLFVGVIHPCLQRRSVLGRRESGGGPRPRLQRGGPAAAGPGRHGRRARAAVGGTHLAGHGPASASLRSTQGTQAHTEGLLLPVVAQRLADLGVGGRWWGLGLGSTTTIRSTRTRCWARTRTCPTSCSPPDSQVRQTAQEVGGRGGAGRRTQLSKQCGGCLLLACAPPQGTVCSTPLRPVEPSPR